MKKKTLLATLALASFPLLADRAPEKAGAALGDAPKVALAELQKNPDAYAGKTIQTEGKVSAVCAQKGCWMTLGDGQRPVRVTFKDYAFFVPKDIAGAAVVAEGVFSVKTIPEATAKHYAEETPGKKARDIKGDQKELSLEASGVEIRRPN